MQPGSAEGHAQALAGEETVASIVRAPMPAVEARMLNGGISLSAIFMTGQVKPQMRQRPTSINLACTSPAPAVAPAGPRFS